MEVWMSLRSEVREGSVCTTRKSGSGMVPRLVVPLPWILHMHPNDHYRHPASTLADGPTGASSRRVPGSVPCLQDADKCHRDSRGGRVWRGLPFPRQSSRPVQLFELDPSGRSKPACGETRPPVPDIAQSGLSGASRGGIS